MIALNFSSSNKGVGFVNPHFSPTWVEIGKRDEIQDASSENEGAYCFVCDRVRVDDATQ